MFSPMPTGGFARMTMTLALAAPVLLAFAAPQVKAATIEKIERRGKLEVCLNPDAMPYSTAFDGEKGLHIDLANAIARELGVSTLFSWVQFRFQAKYTHCDAFMGVGVLPGEDDGPTKKTKPIFDFDTLLVSRPGLQLDTLEALDGRKIAVQTGSLAHVTLLDRPVDVRVSYIREEVMLAAIADGTLDAGFVSNVGLNWYLKNNPKAEFKIWPATIAQDKTGYPIAIGLRRADKATLDRFNEILDKLAATGEMARIFDKYGLAGLLRTP